MYINKMHLEFDSKSTNESFARVTVAAFVAQLDPTLEEIADIKTAVSEAVTNSIIHGYQDGIGKIEIDCKIVGRNIEITDAIKAYVKEKIGKVTTLLLCPGSFGRRLILCSCIRN